jgi:2-polyprenyl-6-methoxyphenol hydroxylase-like FAD-dependent oxidoreductase
MYNAPGGRVASVRPGRLPGELKVGLSFRGDAPAYERGDAAAQKQLIARRLAGAGWEVSRLLEAMRDAPDFYFHGTGQVRMERWTRGRAALVGDAGYCPTPLTGLGTSLALVGAYVLAGELAAAGGDVRAALARYEDVMRPYVAKAQELPPGGVGGFAPKRALSIRLRAASMRWMTRRPLRQMFAHQFDKAADIELPDYAARLVAA